MAIAVKNKHPFAVATPKVFRPGNATKPKKDLSSIVRWPKCVQLQRKRKILLQKLKIPPALYQFHTTLDKNTATALFRFLQNYRPESPEAKRERLVKEAESRVAGSAPNKTAINSVVTGLNEVTKSIETKKAKLVIIANDVMPIELVCWLPALCRRMQVPYCIVKNKSRLGTFVHMKNCAAIALTEVNSGDKNAFDNLTNVFAPMYINNADARRKWGN